MTIFRAAGHDRRTRPRGREGRTTATIFRPAALAAIVVLAPAAGSAAVQQEIPDTPPAAAPREVPDTGPEAARHEVPDAGGRVYGLVGGGFGTGEFIAVGVGAGLRLTRHVGLDVELTHLSGDDDDDHWPGAWFGGVSAFDATLSAEDYPPVGVDVDALSLAPVGRDVTTFLTKFTVEFPVADGRLFPYLTGGGGVGRVTEGYGVFPFPMMPWEDVPLDGTDAVDDGSLRFSEFGVFPSAAAYSELGLALVLGGGVDVRLWRGFALGGDIRWLRVLRDYDALDLAQVTARLSYRF